MEFGPSKKLVQEIVGARNTTEKEASWFKIHETPDVDKLRKLFERTDKKVLGAGTEFIVIEEGEDRVIAIKHSILPENVLEAKKDFYVHKILNILYPDKFPKFYSSFIKEDEDGERVSGTVRQKINAIGKKEKTTNEHLKVFGLMVIEMFMPKVALARQDKERAINIQTVTPFFNIVRTLEGLGIKIHLDLGSWNLATDKEGNSYYLDMVGHAKLDVSSKENLLSFMQEHDYSESDIKTVSSSLDRFLVLDSQKENSVV